MAAATSVVVLDRGNNTTCTINLHGATVVSWRVNNQEQLFVSKQAVFDGKKAIRGGIPFVFPQFGAWTFGPPHGFARIIRWNVEKSPERLPSGDVEAIFSIMDSEFTRSMWNYPFRLTYRLILREKELHFNIGVYNPSKDHTFSFNLLLHTYFKVPDVRRCQITGLHGCTFIDKTRDNQIFQEGRDVVTVCEWTDRIYQNTQPEHIITNVVSGRKMRVQKYNFPDTVVWNPWQEKARDIPDFGDDEFPNMICVESGHVSSPVILLPGTAFEASQILQVKHTLRSFDQGGPTSHVTTGNNSNPLHPVPSAPGTVWRTGAGWLYMPPPPPPPPPPPTSTTHQSHLHAHCIAQTCTICSLNL
ncbi:Glucose-6-phosphate 1-epimerase [Dufourea novaeangliae]|uniref:Galactose mutarotase n=1 Tax=Dufourea novaeangliae TaxID=178035 RepID=A0A154PDI4_DUFNO|nr:Glucose-6-phosphate 1-epimerase [Dufourea novaeangliae]